ncbi:alpha-L-fucosidase-like [Paramacrobiotus metropolitanus]|uniref:alpha-L-fucosidase-like n=1 Tax=Paramacrobiotus metropolitanus TaxID=2943436 RepID=UPI00244624A5|nr:alpha-L-fucosidase-like [Paramacrobiotus metropolitanus]
MRVACACLLLVTVVDLVSCKKAKSPPVTRYDPTWDSIDSRPLPDWYDESKLGIFIHWGVFSVIGYQSEWVWWDWKGAKDPNTVAFFDKNYPPDITYADFGQQFHATFFNPLQWSAIFANSGAKYIVLTSKHHEGYTNWPSNYSWNWNSMDVGPHRDLVGDLAKAIRNSTDLHFGLYHSLFEWFHPLYLEDKANNWTTRSFPTKKSLPELYEIVNTYQPDVIWSDGDWEAPDTYWNSTGFIAWLYNDSPVKDTVVTNDRWGSGITCHHGGFLTCSDKYNPGTLQPRKWENCMTLDFRSWGYRRDLTAWDVIPIETLIATLTATVSCGGNLLVNVGPTGDGTIPPIFQERLLQLGSWMQVNGEAIYNTKPWSHQNDTLNPNVWYTSKATGDGVDVYAAVLKWDGNVTLSLGAPKPSQNTIITMLGTDTPLKWTVSNQVVVIRLPALQSLPTPQEWGYVLKLTQLTNKRRSKRIMPLPARFLKYSKIRYVH